MLILREQPNQLTKNKSPSLADDILPQKSRDCERGGYIAHGPSIGIAIPSDGRPLVYATTGPGCSQV